MSSQDDISRRRSRRHLLSFEAMEGRRLLSTATPIHAAVMPPGPRLPPLAGTAPRGPASHPSGSNLPSASDVGHVGSQYVKLAFSHASLRVGKSYVRAVLKGDGKALKHLGNSIQVKSLGKQFEDLGHSSSVKHVGKQFQNLGKSVSHWFK
jgi:hypothetical protein